MKRRQKLASTFSEDLVTWLRAHPDVQLPTFIRGLTIKLGLGGAATIVVEQLVLKDGGEINESEEAAA